MTGVSLDAAGLATWRERALRAALETDASQLAASLADPVWAPATAVPALTQLANRDWDQPNGRAAACSAIACRRVLECCAGGQPAIQDRPLPLLYHSALGKLLAEAFDSPETWVQLTLDALSEIDPRSDPAIHADVRRGLVMEILRLSGTARAARIEEAVARLEQAMRCWQELAGTEVLVQQSLGNGALRNAHWCAECAVDLAALHRHRLRGNPADNLERASMLLDLAIGLIDSTSAPSLWAAAKHQRGVVCLEQTERGLAYRIDDAMQSLRQALAARTAERSLADWAETTVALAQVLVLIGGSGDVACLDEAIGLCRTAVRRLDGHENRLLAAPLLLAEGNALQVRARTGGNDDLFRAIDIYNGALEEPGIDDRPMDRSLILHMRAIAQWHLAGPDRVEYLDKSMQDLDMARSLVDPAEHPWPWARIATTMGGVLWQPEHPNRPENIELAVQVLREAGQLRTRAADPVGWSRVCFLLGNCHADRESGDRMQDLLAAVRYYRDCLSALDPVRHPGPWTDATNNLGTVLLEPPLGHSASNRQAGAVCFQSVLDRIRVEQFPERVRRAAANLGHLRFSEEDWEGAAAAFAHAASAVETIVGAATTDVSQQAELRVVRGIHARWAFALGRLNRPLEAAVALETGRARGMRRALRLGRLALESADPAARTRMESTIREIGELRARRPREPEAYAAIADDIKQRLDCLQTHLEHLGLSDTGSADEIMDACSPDSPLCYLAATSGGGIGIVVRRRNGAAAVGADVVFLPGLCSAELERLLGGPIDKRPIGATGWLPAQQAVLDARMRMTAVDPRDQTLYAQAAHGVSQAQRQWFSVVETTIEELRERVARRICDTLDWSRGMRPSSLVLIPCGHTVLLPMAAAFHLEFSGRRACDHEHAAAVATAPSANALLQARRALDDTGAERLLVVGGVAPGGDRLPCLDAETAAVSCAFPTAIRLTSDASTERVLALLEDTDVAHFVAHGLADTAQPESSELQLPSGERLTVGDLIARTGRRKRLAVLSACESGVPGHELPDEVIALPSSFLKAGFAGVVASQWLAEDLGSSLLMERFYHYWRTHALPPEHALSRAQAWIRSTDPASMLAYYEELAEGRWGHDAPVPDCLRETALKYASLLWARDESDAMAFATLRHPITWAAFHFVGV